MDIQAVKIRHLRAQHGWTQQHLADACAISLRTIQRIEKDGNAAPETLAALCAVFEISREELLVVPRRQAEQMKAAQIGSQWLSHAVILTIGVALGAGLTILVMN